MKTLSKFDQLNFIGDIWAPHYNGDTGDGSKSEVYIAKWKVTRSKRDIKLIFEKVSGSSMYTGTWFLAKKDIPKRTKFDNNRMECYVVPWSRFEPLIINERDERMLW